VTLLYTICFTKRLHICTHLDLMCNDVEGISLYRCGLLLEPSLRKNPMDVCQAAHEEQWNPGRGLGRQRYGVYQADFVLVKLVRFALMPWFLARICVACTLISTPYRSSNQQRNSTCAWIFVGEPWSVCLIYNLFVLLLWNVRNVDSSWTAKAGIREWHQTWKGV
jgi:hypothetical protein